MHIVQLIVLVLKWTQHMLDICDMLATCDTHLLHASLRNGSKIMAFCSVSSFSERLFSS